MAQCCGSSKRKMGESSCCGGEKKRTVLLYACSCGANVGEISDEAARELMFSGCGTMFCLAGLGAGIPGLVQMAKDADLNLIIDGCPTGCGKKVLDKAGIANCVHVKVTDLGIEKQKGVRCTKEQVDRVVAMAKEVLSK